MRNCSRQKRKSLRSGHKKPSSYPASLAPLGRTGTALHAPVSQANRNYVLPVVIGAGESPHRSPGRSAVMRQPTFAPTIVTLEFSAGAFHPAYHQPKSLLPWTYLALITDRERAILEAFAVMPSGPSTRREQPLCKVRGCQRARPDTRRLCP
jgi:hypothetical protein